MKKINYLYPKLYQDILYANYFYADKPFARFLSNYYTCNVLNKSYQNLILNYIISNET